MENHELLRRVQDLSVRCSRADILTHSAFLTPAEQAAVAVWAQRQPGCRFFFHGGHPDCERKAVFFLPEYLQAEDFDPQSALCAVGFSCAYGAPGHRDYLGAILSSGVRREWLGDIWVQDGQATVFCLPTVADHLTALEQIGRYSVRAQSLPLRQVAAPVRQRQAVSFTVQSLRLDAILGDLFGLSRTAAAKLIAAGAASVNYVPCLKADAPVKPGDILSLRGYGKGAILELGGLSRKGRRYVKAERYQ